MKHGEGKDAAHDLYVYQYMTFDEIATKIGRSDKTIRVWADEDGWREERERLTSSKRNLHEKLHTLANKIADRMINDCDSESTLSPQSLHGLSNILNALNKAYKYEDDVETSTDENTPKKDVSADELAERVREILGA